MKGNENMITAAKKEALTEKVFKQSIAVSVFCIVLCMVALCSVTWAYFSAEALTDTSNIKPAYCDVNALVISEGTELDSIDGKYTLAKNKPYEIQVTPKGTASSAYCILKIGGLEYYTVQIPTSAPGNQISFTLQFDADTTELEIITRWGTSSKSASERSFEDGGKYLNLEKKDTLPTVTSDSKAQTDPASKQESTDPAAVTTDPKPTESAPTESAPTESTPTEPTPTESTPTESAPTESAPTESAPTESTPTEPASPKVEGAITE